MYRDAGAPGFFWVDTSDVITEEQRQTALAELSRMFATGDYVQAPEKPSFQTGQHLFSKQEFLPFRKTFIKACVEQVPFNRATFMVDSVCSCYMDYWDNYKLKDREAQWHFHEHAYFSGIYYLEVPESMDPSICGTEFRDPDIYMEPRRGHWLIFPGRTLHRPGVVNTNDKRYVLAADFRIAFFN